MPETVSNLLIEVKARLREIYGSRLQGVYLYGSYARGDQEPGSDVDILILLDRIGSYGLEIDRTGELISNLSLKFGLSISRLFVSENDWKYRDTPFLANAREEAIPA
jgi:uncharacterized protein